VRDSSIYPLSPAPFSSTLVSPGTAISILFSSHDYNIWSSLFNHVVRLDTFLAEDFNFLRLCHWFSRMWEPLLRTRQAILPFTLMTSVLSVWYCAAVRNSSVSFFKLPDVNHAQLWVRHISRLSQQLSMKRFRYHCDPVLSRGSMSK